MDFIGRGTSTAEEKWEAELASYLMLVVRVESKEKQETRLKGQVDSDGEPRVQTQELEDTGFKQQSNIV